MRDIYSSFGIMNLFSPNRPSGSYLLQLNIFEERMVCKMLLELCKAEGWGNMTAIKVNGKSQDTITLDFLLNLPTIGTFEGTYACPENKVKNEIREKIGQKYLDW